MLLVSLRKMELKHMCKAQGIKVQLCNSTAQGHGVLGLLM